MAVNKNELIDDCILNITNESFRILKRCGNLNNDIPVIKSANHSNDETKCKTRRLSCFPRITGYSSKKHIDRSRVQVSSKKFRRHSLSDFSLSKTTFSSRKFSLNAVKYASYDEEKSELADFINVYKSDLSYSEENGYLSNYLPTNILINNTRFKSDDDFDNENSKFSKLSDVKKRKKSVFYASKDHNPFAHQDVFNFAYNSDSKYKIMLNDYKVFENEVNIGQEKTGITFTYIDELDFLFSGLKRLVNLDLFLTQNSVS